MLDFLSENKQLLFIAAAILAVLMVGIQLLLNMVNEHKAKKDKIYLQTENIDLKNNLENISSQNNELIKGKDTLIFQNSELTKKVDEYQNENKRLKSELSQVRVESFDLTSNPGPDGGLRVESRRTALDRHYNSAVNDFFKGDIQKAKTTLELIIEKDSNYTDAWSLLGAIFNKLGNDVEALRCLNKAYELSKSPQILKNIKWLEQHPGEKFENVDRGTR